MHAAQAFWHVPDDLVWAVTYERLDLDPLDPTGAPSTALYTFLSTCLPACLPTRDYLPVSKSRVLKGPCAEGMARLA